MSRSHSPTSFPTGQAKIVLFEGIHKSARLALESADMEVIEIPGALPENELIDALQGAHLVGLRSKTQLTASVLSKVDRLMGVGCFCIGTNQVDLAAANKLGIPVFNAPFSNTRSVAELIVAEVVMLSRHLGDCCRELHRGEWKKSATGRHEVRGKTLGIIGYGHIGSQVGVLAEAFGMRVQFFDIAKRLPMGNNQDIEDLEKLLNTSDFVSLHVPATPETEGMIQAEHLAMMKDGACILNASRGTVVNLEALALELKSGRLAGAAVDVYPKEPRKNGEQFDSPLIGLQNVVLTPHIGGSTEEAQEAIGREVAASLIALTERGTTMNSVNFPQIDLPLKPGSHRIINAHRNVPGVMANILRILSDLGANIHAQALSTDEHVGYLITDLDQGVSEEVKTGIASLSTSIKTRILYGR